MIHIRMKPKYRAIVRMRIKIKFSWPFFFKYLENLKKGNHHNSKQLNNEMVLKRSPLKKREEMVSRLLKKI